MIDFFSFVNKNNILQIVIEEFFLKAILEAIFLDLKSDVTNILKNYFSSIGVGIGVDCIFSVAPGFSWVCTTGGCINSSKVIGISITRARGGIQ